MARRLVITSGKGGVGKTTVVEGLGIALSRLGYKTLVVDMDFGLNNLDVLLGVENKIVYDMIDIIEGRCRPMQAIIEDIFENNLFILPSTHSFCKYKFGTMELMKIISSVESDFDFVLIDCPAGMDGGFRRAVGCGSEYIVVTTPHLSAIRDADKVSSFIYSTTQKMPSLIINRARGDLIMSGEMLSIESIRDNLNCNLIGVIPEDDVVSKKLFTGRVLSLDSQSEISFDMIAKVLTTDRRNLYDVTLKYKGFIGNIRKKLRRRV